MGHKIIKRERERGVAIVYGKLIKYLSSAQSQGGDAVKHMNNS